MAEVANVENLDFKLRDELNGYLNELVKDGGSDLHIKATSVIKKRIRGEIMSVANDRVFSSEEAITLAKELLRGRFSELVEKKSVDFTYKLDENYRFRVNIFFQMTGVSAVFRVIPVKIPNFDDLKLPASIKEIADSSKRGLVLVTGPTGSGKSTTLAAMINHMNKTRKAHVITIEDPIEFVYTDDNSIINQRSIGQDATNFADALRSALREDPDIILVGEMRDLETIDIAIRAAETGHLVLSTLHTLDAKDTISRIVSMFPGHEQNRIRISMASVLKAVISQRLCRTKDSSGQVAALEILRSTPRISNLIVESRDNEIYDAINDSAANSGMQTFDKHLLDLYKDGIISGEMALTHSSNPNDLRLKIKNVDMQNDEINGAGEQDRDIIPLKALD